MSDTARIDGWCEYHHNLNNIGRDRRVKQLRVLHELAASMTVPIEQIDGPDLERFMVAMIRDGYHPHTVVFNLRLVKPFVRHLWAKGEIDAERWLRIQSVRPPRGAYNGQPRPYSRAEVRRFWRELDARYPWTYDNADHRTPARGEYWVRRWAAGTSDWKRVYPYARRLQVEAIVALALYAGLRRDEIFKMGLEQMHYLAEYLQVTSRKGPQAEEKIRVVAMNKPLGLAIGNWTEFRAQVLAPEHEHPWLCLWSRYGATKPMSHTQFSALLTEIGGGWKFHRLRHTFATERYRAGMPIEILQATLGHARVTQTLAYARIDEDRIIAASQASDEDFLKAVQSGRESINTSQEVA